MKKLIISSILIGLLAGCGAPSPDHKQNGEGSNGGPSEGYNRNIDPELESYVENFESRYGLSVNYRIKFVNEQDGQKVGVCRQWDSGAKIIELYAPYFHSVTYYQQLQLVYHEMGHCSLNLGHEGGTVVFDGVTVPASIMDPYAFSSAAAEAFQNHYDYYSQEMIK